MGERIIETNTISIPTCDKCGCDLGDGTKTQDGFPIFWGVRSFLKEYNAEEVVVARSEYAKGSAYRFEVKASFTEDDEYFTLCKNCKEDLIKWFRIG